MKLTSKQAARIADDTVKTAAAAQLVYTTEDQLSIIRKPHGRGFVYFESDIKITDESSLARFKSLVIPPAWIDVRISSNLDSHLQVTGRDSKGRKQYRYHPRWNQVRNSTKFFRMIAFGEALPALRKQIERDITRKKMDRKKVLALVVSLMEETHIRIGSDEYARKNKTYGLSTMRSRHLIDDDGEMRFRFVGKKGKKHNVLLKDKKLRKLVMQCEEIPGWELFQFWDEDGNHQSIDSGMINDYIQEITSNSFTAKDFRTWAASKIFLETIVAFDEPETQKDRAQNIVEACNRAASELGNTRTVCKNYYIHPAVVQAYEKGQLEKYRNPESKFSDELEPSEKFLLNIIENYSFNIPE